MGGSSYENLNTFQCLLITKWNHVLLSGSERLVCHTAGIFRKPASRTPSVYVQIYVQIYVHTQPPVEDDNGCNNLFFFYGGKDYVSIDSKCYPRRSMTPARSTQAEHVGGKRSVLIRIKRDHGNTNSEMAVSSH